MYNTLIKIETDSLFMTQSSQHTQSKEHNTYSDVMKTIQCAHPSRLDNDFVATCRLWTTSGRVHALLVSGPTESSTSTRLGA